MREERERERESEKTRSRYEKEKIQSESDLKEVFYLMFSGPFLCVCACVPACMCVCVYGGGVVWWCGAVVNLHTHVVRERQVCHSSAAGFWLSGLRNILFISKLIFDAAKCVGVSKRGLALTEKHKIGEVLPEFLLASSEERLSHTK